MDNLDQIERALAARDRALAEYRKYQEEYWRYDGMVETMLGLLVFIALTLFASVPFILLALWVMDN